jgi:hypothetical protein
MVSSVTSVRANDPSGVAQLRAAGLRVTAPRVAAMANRA